MKPLAACDDARLAQVRVLATDVDDTLTEHGAFTGQAIAALERARAAGLSVVAVTGRPLGFVEVAMRWLPFDAAVGENGGGWFAREGRALRAYLVDEDMPRAAAARARALAVGRAAAPEVPVPDDGWARRVDVAFDVGEARMASTHERAALRDALQGAGFHTVTSSIHLHAAHAPYDKATGLVSVLRDGLQLPASVCDDALVYVGDSDNDAAAFAAVGLSVGVANLDAAAVRVRPAFVTEAARGAGVAELVDRLLSARRRAS
jgi:HAD superfamily hydrolase (TIGR01484 family)